MLPVNEAFQDGKRIEAWDLNTGLMTRWDLDGQVLEQRELTEEEIASLTPPPDPRQELLDKLTNETATMDDLKQVLIEALSKGLV